MKHDAKKPATAVSVAESQPEEAEIIGGRWDGLGIEVPIPGADLVLVASANLDQLARHPEGPARDVTLRRIATNPTRFSEVLTTSIN